MGNIKDAFGRWRKKVGEATKKAEHLAGNTWQHCKLLFVDLIVFFMFPICHMKLISSAG